METHWYEHVTGKTLSLAGLGEINAIAEYEEFGGEETYEIYVGKSYDAAGEEIEFLVVDMVGVKENPRYVWFGVFEEQDLSDFEDLCNVAKEVVRTGRKINYGDLELTFRDSLKSSHLFE